MSEPRYSNRRVQHYFLAFLITPIYRKHFDYTLGPPQVAEECGNAYLVDATMYRSSTTQPSRGELHHDDPARTLGTGYHHGGSTANQTSGYASNIANRPREKEACYY